MAREPYRELARSFVGTIRLFHQTFFRHASTPLPFNQFFILLMLKDEGRPLTIHELAQALRLRKQQMTPNADRLVALGYVTKSLLPADRRYTRLALTRKGRAFIREQDERLLSMIEDGLRRLDAGGADDLGELRLTIARFREALEHIARAKAESA